MQQYPEQQGVFTEFSDNSSWAPKPWQGIKGLTWLLWSNLTASSLSSPYQKDASFPWDPKHAASEKYKTQQLLKGMFNFRQKQREAWVLFFSTIKLIRCFQYCSKHAKCLMGGWITGVMAKRSGFRIWALSSRFCESGTIPKPLRTGFLLCKMGVMTFASL